MSAAARARTFAPTPGGRLAEIERSLPTLLQASEPHEPDAPAAVGFRSAMRRCGQEAFAMGGVDALDYLRRCRAGSGGGPRRDPRCSVVRDRGRTMSGVTVTGGEKLDARLKVIATGLRRASTLRVGWLDGATEADGTPVALVAMANEFGDPARGRPPRPAIRNTVAAKSGEWRAKFAALLKANDYDADRALALLGEIIKGDLQQAIVDYSGPALNPATVARKGSAKQLVDSGQEIQSLGYEVD